MLNDSRKKIVATVGIEPRPLAQVSETILTELTYHLAEDLKVLNPYMSCSINFDFS